MSNDSPKGESNTSIGLNQNIQIGNTEYHIQTEDLRRQTLIRTQVFVQGVVQKRYELDYSQAVGKPHLITHVAKALKSFHIKVVRRLELGGNISIPPRSTVKINAVPTIKTEVVKKSPGEVWNTLTNISKLKRPAWDQIIANNHKK